MCWWKLLSRIHPLGDEIINDGDHWVIDLFNPLSSREITKEEIILMVSKRDGFVLRITMPDLERYGFSRVFMRDLVIRYGKINSAVDITLEQANTVAQRYIYIIRHKDFQTLIRLISFVVKDSKLVLA